MARQGTPAAIPEAVRQARIAAIAAELKR
jgi:hypothetical protein